MRFSTSREDREISGRRGPLIHWYIDIIIAVFVVSLAASLFFHSWLGLAAIEEEKYLLMLILHHMGIEALDSGPARLLVVGGGHVFTIIIVPVCTGLYGVIVFLFVAIALPFIPLRRKLVAALVYIPLLITFNIARMVIGVLVGIHYGLRAFELYHGTFSTVLTIIVFAILWTHWFYNSVMGEEAREFIMRRRGKQ